MTTFFDPPTLRTLNANPSWINRAGRVDRSACFELKASNLWPYATFETYPKGKREATSEITISARFLSQLMDQHHPHQLQGDSRTSKSRAMKDSFQHSAISGQPELQGNPNKGASRTKMLGLWEAWQQTVAIERHRLHKNLAQHFLICPNSIPLSSSLLSPSPLGRGARGEGLSSLSSSPCQGKSLKLFLPLCTKAEALDADTAEAWLNQLDLRSQITQTSIVSSLINRYGLLFRAERKLICRKCLNLRYGQVRKASSEG